jgi:hypothetical protein
MTQGGFGHPFLWAMLGRISPSNGASGGGLEGKDYQKKELACTYLFNSGSIKH